MLAATPLLAYESSIHLQIQLHPVTHPVVLECQHVFEGALPLPLQHDFVRFPPDVSGD
ncbi:MAG: hypothetical protein Q9194_007380 [Teloschistes cf. exilis]